VSDGPVIVTVNLFYPRIAGKRRFAIFITDVKSVICAKNNLAVGSFFLCSTNTAFFAKQTNPMPGRAQRMRKIKDGAAVAEVLKHEIVTH
jgi:hypothetical protein